MSEHVRMRTDSIFCGWWCDKHEKFTGYQEWCFYCDFAEVRDQAAEA